jgi:hexosaminidase
MKRIIFLLMTLSLHLFSSASNVSNPATDAENIANADYAVVPLPQKVTAVAGKPFILDASTKICCTTADALLMRDADFLSQYIRQTIGLELPVSRDATCHVSSGKVICLSLDSHIKNEEGYRLTVTSKRITIAGATAAGVFYGIQTLRKSLPVIKGDAVTSISMPTVVIDDAPRFAYRGMMLDCARHFFPVSFVKEFIDILALHGLNTFHWHLTDDQGWRIEIKAYPRLTEIGSQRSGTVIGNNSDLDDGIAYGGFYTQQDVKDIVAYAHDRYITVIPEIDMPGHAMAALAAYPELGCTGGPYQVGHRWGVYNDVLCVGNEKTYDFVRNVLSEVISLFPSEYIHIGGDETPTVRWDKCPRCQAVQHEGETLQGHFTKIVERFLASKGRRMIGWDELLGSGISTDATIMSWRGTKPGVKAAEAGHDVVMTPLTHCYFDYYQAEKHNYEPSITGMWPIDVNKVYSLNPVPDSLSASAKKHIIGVQANLWTEYIPSAAVAEYMLLPRLAALAEVQWSASDKKDFDAFKLRLTRFTHLYDLCGWKYAVHLWPERMTKDRWHN